LRALAIDPSSPTKLYAGASAGGLFASTDGAATWHGVGGPAQKSVRVIAVAPSAGAIVYAGVDTGRVRKSVDGGASWTEASTGLAPTRAVIALAVDPTDPDVVYAGTDQGGLFKTTTGGASWSPANTGLTQPYWGYAFAIDPTNPLVVYVGTGGGVFKSTDGGANWSAANSGINGVMRTLAIDPSHPNTLYGGGSCGGVFKTIDGGTSWNPASTGLTTTQKCVYGLALAASSPSILYAATGTALMKTTDGGDHWIVAYPAGTSFAVTGVVVDPIDPERVVAGGESGLVRTTDGSNWTQAVQGFSAVDVGALAADPLVPGRVYAGTNVEPHAYRTEDGGVSWTVLAEPLPFGGAGPLTAIAPDPANPGTVYAGYSYATGGLFASADAGDTWTSLGGGWAFVTFTSLLVDPADPNRIYLGGAGNVAGMFYGVGIVRSVDGGATWHGVGAQDPSGDFGALIEDIVAEPSTPGTFYAASSMTPPGVYRSTDDGDTWSLPSTDLAGVSVYALAVHPTIAETVYAGTSAGVFKTTNAGDAWTASSTGLAAGRVFGLSIDPATPTTVWAGIDGAGVYRSLDDGATWTAMNAGLGHFGVTNLLIGPGTPAAMYAGTRSGVFRWVECGNGTPEPSEACDDGGAADGDGCSAACQVEVGWTCASAPSVCTPCVAIAGGRLVVQLRLPAPGDETLVLKGALSVAGSIDPLAGGLRLRFADGASVVADVAIPGDAFDPVTKVGWTPNASLTRWKYGNQSASPPGGVTKVSIADQRPQNGRVLVRVRATRGTYDVGTNVTAEIAIPSAAACGAAHASGPDPTWTCEVRGTKLRCR
jgi:cysteine-rich repeat protein